MKTKLLLHLALLSTINPQLSTCHASPLGTAFTYQGRLDDGGSPASGVYDLRFRVWDSELNGTPASTTLTYTVPITNGLFTVLLDFGSGVFAGEARWLEMSVSTNGAGAFTTLLPRQPMTATPYAIMSGSASNLLGLVPASQLSGTIPGGNLPASPAFAGTVSAATFAGNGATVTNVNAASLNGQTAANFWQVGGNYISSGQFLGSTNSQVLEFRVNNTGGLRLEPVPTSANSSNMVNLVGGSACNAISSGVYGSVIVGGGGYYYGFRSNAVAADWSFLGGGLENSIALNASASVLGGGENNSIQTSASHSVLGGGVINSIQTNAYFSVLGGGSGNSIQTGASCSALGGGTGNSIQWNASYSFLGGGTGNSIQWNDSYSFLGGGGNNSIQPNTAYSVLGGGAYNSIQPYAGVSVLGGGGYNCIQTNAVYSVLGGGYCNTNGASYSVVPGGSLNNAGGPYSFAAGHRAKANYTGDFVWADSLEADFVATANNQFLVRASGGVGINTNNPNGAALNVNGAVTATSFDGNGAGLVGVVPTDNSVTSAKIANGAITDSDIASGAAISASKIAGGPGSGLNADLLDGLQASSFAPAAHGHDAAAITSGTLVDARLAGNVARTNQVWLLGGNAGTTTGPQFLGTRDNQPLELKVNQHRALRLEPNATSPNVIAGHSNNWVRPDVYGAAIGGGGAPGGVSWANVVMANYGTIAGGTANQISTNSVTSTIGGGDENLIGPNSTDATIAGGYFNICSGGAAVIGGGRENRVDEDALYGTVSGGLRNRIATNSNFSSIGGGENNTVAAPFGTCSGGASNQVSAAGGFVGGGGHDGSSYSGNTASGPAAVAVGGTQNLASGNRSTVGGGSANAATNWYATIPGGAWNLAGGQGSFAAGQAAKARHDGAFVWSDNWNPDVVSTNANSVTMRASGGYRLFSNNGMTAGVHLAAGGGSWTTLSDRNAKENFRSISPTEVLAKVAALPLTTWNYKSQDAAVRHLGPMAQDFKAAFGLGESDTGITGVDADGVALAAIQGLNQKVESENAALKQEVAELKRLVSQLSDKINGGAK